MTFWERLMLDQRRRLRANFASVAEKLSALYGSWATDSVGGGTLDRTNTSWLDDVRRVVIGRHDQLLERHHLDVDKYLFNAVCRNLESSARASRKVGADFRAAHTEIPWREMNDLRNVLIHDYEGADPDLVWAIVERDMPTLLAAVRVRQGTPQHVHVWC
jgi:uncharacterized protein with HEPN domain